MPRHSSSDLSPPELSDMRTCLLDREEVTLLETLEARSTELRVLTDCARLLVTD